MFPAELFTDRGFWLFTAFYVASVFIASFILQRLTGRTRVEGVASRLGVFIVVLFSLLLVYQFFHQAEHVTQMYQFQFLGFSSHDAHGFVWFLDDEWNHFVFNVGYLIGITTVFVALFRGLKKAGVPYTFGTIGLMVIFLVFEGWHVVEHTYRITHHVQGLCDECAGIIDSTFGVNRLVLHFWLNFFALAFPAAVYMQCGIFGRLKAALKNLRIPAMVKPVPAK